MTPEHEEWVRELSKRARYLLKVQGSECVFDNGEPFSWRDLHVDQFLMTLTESGQLTIRHGADRTMIYTQCEPDKLGRLDKPAPALDLVLRLVLKLRRLMVLDDLANV